MCSSRYPCRLWPRPWAAASLAMATPLVNFSTLNFSKRQSLNEAFGAPQVQFRMSPATNTATVNGTIVVGLDTSIHWPDSAVSVHCSDSIIDTALLDNGPVWQVFQLATTVDVMAVDSSKVNWQDHKTIGLISPHASGSECQYEVRMLAPSSGMSEDPITGSLNAAIVHWLCERRILTENIIVAQGACINRLGRLHIQLDPYKPSQVLVGGSPIF
ncbi:MAG: PhzF family phenazine biosynthesis protein [Granulosicoccus sp.]